MAFCMGYLHPNIFSIELDTNEAFLAKTGHYTLDPVMRQPQPDFSVHCY